MTDFVHEHATARGSEPQGGSVRVLEADPGLARGLDGAERASAAQRSFAPTLPITPGPWYYEPDPELARGLLGLLVLEGVFLREVTVDRMAAVEFLGPGDLMRPWGYDAESAPIVAPARWHALEAGRVAVLDRRFALRMAPWPEVSAALLERNAERIRAMTVELAVRQALRIEDRLLLTLWHLADRWGRVSPLGTVLGLRGLTHGRLARLIGAQRPSVTLALGRLRERGLVDRAPDGSWVLLGDPPGDVHVGEMASASPR